MHAVVTIAQRKARATALRRQAIERAVDELRQYAKREGGRFMIFGSAAKNQVHEHSDLDVIIDFPDAQRQDALFFAQDTCLKHGVPCDAQDMPREGSPFLERIREHAVLLP